MNHKEKILFLCVNNSCRSQMAEAIVRSHFSDQYEVYSAGSDPTQVNKNAIQVLKELNIDASIQYSKSVDKFKEERFDYVITVCKEEKCPVFLGDAKKRIHKTFDDPGETKGSQEEILEEFRRVRDNIKTWVLDTFA